VTTLGIEGEKFLTAGLADVLKSGYETFERPGSERGSCCESLDCPKVSKELFLANDGYVRPCLNIINPRAALYESR
jgi:hypothetical protein